MLANKQTRVILAINNLEYGVVQHKAIELADNMDPEKIEVRV